MGFYREKSFHNQTETAAQVQPRADNLKSRLKTFNLMNRG